MMNRFDDNVGVAGRNPEAQQFRKKLENQLNSCLKSAQFRNNEEVKKALNESSKETLNSCDMAIENIPLPCDHVVLQRIKAKMMNQFDSDVGAAGRHPEAQKFRKDFETQIDQRVKEAILENSLTKVNRDLIAECIVEIKAIRIPCKDVETTLDQIKQRKMNDFVRRMNGVADDNPQKKRFRSVLNITFDRHFRVVRVRNVIDSLELLKRVVEELIEKLKNISLFTRIKTETSEFRTRLKALVLSNSCNQWVAELEMAARCIEEYEDADTAKSVVAGAVGGVMGLGISAAIIALGPFAIPVAVASIASVVASAKELAKENEPNHNEKLLTSIKGRIQTALTEAKREFFEAQRESTKEVLLPNTNNRKRRLPDDSAQSERPSKVRVVEK